MGRHPMGEGIDPNPRIIAERIVDPSALVMGKTAENLHDRFPQLTKERCDAYRRGQPGQARQGATPTGKIAARPRPRGHPARREGLGPRHRPTSRRAPAPPLEDLAALKTPFRPHGNVTAGNAAGLNDGATACILASEAAAAELGLPVRMRLVALRLRRRRARGHGHRPGARRPRRRCARPASTIEDIGLFELNEAFAVQVLAFLDHFGIADDDPRVNPYGGAIATGHPLASSGVRLMTQLARQFEEHPEVRYGLTAMCIGIGMGGCVIWENPHHADYGTDGTEPERRRPGRHDHDAPRPASRARS